MAESSHNLAFFLKQALTQATQAYEQALVLQARIAVYEQKIEPKETVPPSSNGQRHPEAKLDKMARKQSLQDEVDSVQESIRGVFSEASKIFNKIWEISTNPLLRSKNAISYEKIEDEEEERLQMPGEIWAACLDLQGALLKLACTCLKIENCEEDACRVASLLLETIAVVYSFLDGSDSTKSDMYREARVCVCQSHYQSAVRAVEAGDWQRARQEYEALLKIDEHYKDVQEQLCRVYDELIHVSFKAHDLQQSASYLKKLHTLNPGAPAIGDWFQKEPYFFWNVGSLSRDPDFPIPSGEHTCLAVSPDQRYLALGSSSEPVWLYDAKTGQPLYPLRGHKGKVLSIAFSDDSSLLVAGGQGGSVISWNPRTGATVEKPLTFSGNTIEEIVFQPAQDYVAFRSVSKGKDRSIQLWKIRGFSRQPLEDTTSVAFHATKKLFACGKQDGTVEIKHIEKPGTYAFNATKAHHEPVTELFFSPDNLYLCSVSLESQQIILWDINARMQKTPPHDGYMMAFSPDKRFLAFARANNKVGLWDLKQEKYFAIFTLPSELVSKGKASLAAQKEGRVLKIFFLFDGKLWGLVYESSILIVDLANLTALAPGKESPLPCVKSWHHTGGTIASIVKSFDDRRLFVLDDKGALIVLSPGIA